MTGDNRPKGASSAPASSPSQPSASSSAGGACSAGGEGSQLRPLVTPEMVDAGFEALFLYDSERGDPKEMAIKVYLAMEEARSMNPGTNRGAHTPGPWAVRESKADRTYTHVFSATRENLACTKHEPDAILIAAAPDLLAFARNALARLEHGPDANPNDGLLHDARRVISKALGQ